MVHPSNESQQTRTFSVDPENVLPDHYRLIELIGRGGMAEVYLAEDRRLGRKVAIKFLSEEFRRDPDRVRRFRQEARAASALNHPNILIIHDIGDRNGVQFIVSEFVEGETLGLRIAQGKMPIGETVDVSLQIASALAAAHSAGIVHRDMKPDNVMIRPDGVVKVLDFGLAKSSGFTTANGAHFDALTLDSGSTSPGLIVGTPQYMSPEQARGKELDGRTDIFSLGIIIFEMLTRHSPFAAGSFADTMAAILTKEPRQLTEFIKDPPARLTAMIDECLKKEKDERFGSMSEIESELKLLRQEVQPHDKRTVEIDATRSDHTQTIPTDKHSIRAFVSSTVHKSSPLAGIVIVAAAVLLAGSWWAWDRISAGRSESPSLMRTVPITSWSSSASELVTSASFSPDGKMVAYSVLKDDATEIWVKPVVGGDAVQVTKDGGYNQYPIWSPDGQMIVFFSDRGNSFGLWTVPFTGGELSKIVGEISQPTRPVLWSSKGNIYFHSRKEIFRIRRDSSAPEKITNFTEQRTDVRTIQISDDESAIAFSAKEENGWKLKVRQIANGDEKEIASTTDQVDYVAWHPNGKSVFASFEVEGMLQVFEAYVNGDSAVQRSNGDMNFIVHDVAANGSVLYGSLSETSDLWQVDTKTGVESIVANEVATEAFPNISTNGAIAFQVGNQVGRPDWASVRVAAVGSNSSRIASPQGFVPQFSNDGEWIAFIRRSSAGYEVWKARPNGLDSTKVTETPIAAPLFSLTPYLTTSVNQLAWSPDDQSIVFRAREAGKSRLWIVPAAGGQTGRPLGSETPDGVIESSPLWSPDGRHVLSLWSPRPRQPQTEKNYRVYINDVVSGKKRQVYSSGDEILLLGFSSNGREVIIARRNEASDKSATPHQVEVVGLTLENSQLNSLGSLMFAYYYNIHLSSDGENLAYVTRIGERTALAVKSLRSGAEKELLTFNDPKLLVSSLAFAPDGNSIVFGKQTRTHLLSLLTK